MQIRSVLFIVGVLLVCVGASLVLPLGVSLWYGDGAFLGLLSSLVIMVGGGLALAYTNRSQTPLNLTDFHRSGEPDRNPVLIVREPAEKIGLSREHLAGDNLETGANT